MKNKRISDQVLILQAIECVREELAQAYLNHEGDIATTEIVTRLTSLYACIDANSVAKFLKENDERNIYGV